VSLRLVLDPPLDAELREQLIDLWTEVANAGMGTERFYADLGYQEVGRLPGALRIGPDDDRDEIHMWLPLAESQPAESQ
jgi:hypothetical protein